MVLEVSEWRYFLLKDLPNEGEFDTIPKGSLRSFPPAQLGLSPPPVSPRLIIVTLHLPSRIHLVRVFLPNSVLSLFVPLSLVSSFSVPVRYVISSVLATTRNSPWSRLGIFL